MQRCFVQVDGGFTHNVSLDQFSLFFSLCIYVCLAMHLQYYTLSHEFKFMWLNKYAIIFEKATHVCVL